MVGCASKDSGKSKPESPRKDAKPGLQVIETKGANAVFKNSKDETMWDVNWLSGELSIPSSGTRTLQNGAMNDVHGHIFTENKLASTFQSDHGSADNLAKKLVLNNHVHIHALDPKSDLLCDAVMYSGVQKILKAHGHIQVLGTIDSVGTIDDLWATPKLTVIASPELFVKPMIWPLPLPNSMQHSALHTWTDHKGLTMSCQFLNLKNQANVARDIILLGQVSIQSAPEGLTMTSEETTAHAVPSSATSKTFMIQHAVAIGNVKIIKVAETASGKQTTQITGSRADYTTDATDSIAKMAGPVTMLTVDAKGNPLMSATGSTGIATLEPLTRTNLNNGLKKAILDGHTHLALTQIDPTTHVKSIIRTTSDHVTLENLGTNKKVTLTGHVRIKDNDNSELTDADTAVILLDKDGNSQLTIK